MTDFAPIKTPGGQKKRWVLAAVAVIFLLAAAYAGIWWYARLRVEAETTLLAAQNPWIERITCRGIRLSPFVPRFVLKNVEIYTVLSNTPVTIGAVRIFRHEMSGDVPVRIHYALGPIRLPPAVLGDAVGHGAVDLGYGEITGGLTLAWEMDPATGRLNLSDLELTMDRGWESRVSLSLENLDPSLVLNPDPNPFFLLGALQQTKIVSARFSYKDNGLVDRIISRLAKQMQTDKKEAALSLSKDMAAAGSRSEPEIRAFLEAISRFCLPPHSLTLTLDPPEPVPLSRLLFSPDPLGWIKTLGVVAKSPA